ncbi:hypothetical protein ACRE_023830 [Hapsidospora chrysogenum ATCC 11550]|uniref:2EXR domain-containing protein n=1 Tax=Hapsidospora chrysogenum (strain ATCC 11550 / CBS 779.69 / DSM 880 / IAM 14645 / JCM 23072 / IMI 49137) TaxID=857340 RepID=A0A086TBL9_HAPC1|nr:hypothetical protein ACRE_023830 [Hapsidospora chrysogenum ATCC 11550]
MEEDESPDPKFWLKFRTMDDGMKPFPRDSALTPTCTRFPQFSELPPELRLQIWSHLVQPRIVVACCLRRPDYADEPCDRRRYMSRFAELETRTIDRRQAAVPTLLQVNRESRLVGLEHYELTFGWRISKLLSDTPTSRPPRVYFNFAQDALFLTGEIEAYDSYGFNSPMVYFLRREDTFRVKHVALPFRELGYPMVESDQVFGCLWHIVDRFPAAERLLLTVSSGDEEALGEAVGATVLRADNVVQKLWNGWMSGTTVTNSRMANKAMMLVSEDPGLADFVASQS